MRWEDDFSLSERFEADSIGAGAVRQGERDPDRGGQCRARPEPRRRVR